jgi:hypothetical protein
MLGEHEFFYVIPTKAKIYKKRRIENLSTISQLKSQHRLVLTGTPIENSLSDLWSQMNFLNKGLLGNQQYFKREFITPIEKRDDKNQQAKLQMLIRPFVLRAHQRGSGQRPSATNRAHPVLRNARQPERGVRKEKSQIRNAILQTIETEAWKNRGSWYCRGLHAYDNWPTTVDDRRLGKHRIGKFDEIYNCLHDLVAENHKVLIFSRLSNTSTCCAGASSTKAGNIRCSPEKQPTAPK